MLILKQFNEYNSLTNYKNVEVVDNVTYEEENDQRMFVLTISEKIKEIRLNFPDGSVTVLQKMTNYEETGVKITNTH